MSKELIEKAIRARPWRFMIDSDGDHRVDFSTNSPLGDFNAYFTLTSQHLLRCYGFFDLKITREHFSRAIYLCNAYHVSHLYPCVYMESRENSNGVMEGRFWCQTVLDFPNGITVDSLMVLMRQFAGGSASFSEWIVQQPQFWLPAST